MLFHKNKTHIGQKGIVSLIVTVILMLVISLIVIAFARSSRREERDSLDRQLSTNAFYAAESGVNAVRNAIKLYPSLLNGSSYMTNCTGPGSFADAATTAATAAGKPTPITVPSLPIGSTKSNATYTCVFVDPNPSTIEQSITSSPYIFPLQKFGGGILDSVEFSWDAGPGSTTYGGCPSANTNPISWPGNCDSGILRVEVTDLINTYVYFAYPKPGNPVQNINFGTATGTSFSTKCTGGSTPKQCWFNLTNLTSPNPYYVRVSGLYKPYELTVRPDPVLHPSDQFVGAQVLVDATGKASDVERRIQVRYDASNLFGGPQYVLQGGSSICKKFTVDGATVKDLSTNPSTGGPPWCLSASTYPNGTGIPLP